VTDGSSLSAEELDALAAKVERWQRGASCAELEELVSDWMPAVLETIEALQRREGVLAAALRDARAALVDWAAYVPEWAVEKHDLAGDLAAIDEALGADEATGRP
jgi:hypothetical protein